MKRILAISSKLRQNDLTMRRLLLVFILTAICICTGTMPASAHVVDVNSRDFSGYGISKAVVPADSSMWIICQNNPVNFVDLDGRAENPLGTGDMPLPGPIGDSYYNNSVTPIDPDRPYYHLSTKNRSRFWNGSIFDDRGMELFGRWAEGTGDPVLLATYYWGQYMMDNQILKSQIAPRIIKDAKNREDSGSINYNFQAFMEDGYFTGYQHLHATEQRAGHFEISGNASVSTNTSGLKTIHYNLNYIWNDSINPNYDVKNDRFWAAIALFLFPNAADYQVSVNWSSECKIEMSGKHIESQNGYPF